MKLDSLSIVGLGVVGLSLAVAFDEADYDVVGYDCDAERIETLLAGTDSTGEIEPQRIRRSSITFTTDETHLQTARYVIVAVGTPIDDAGRPDLSYIESAVRTVGENLQPGATVVLESTVYPGATDEVVIPLLEAVSGMSACEDFSVAYSPERMVPGDPEHGLAAVTKVVAATSEVTADDVASLYERILDAAVYRAPDIASAELAKCIENIQRDVNIALVNEVAAALEHLDLDTRVVLDIARSKWNFHDYRPGLVDGECTPVDPYYFIAQAERHGFSPELTRTARRVNESVPVRIARLVQHALDAREQTGLPSTRNGPPRVLVLGLAYKPETRDIRARATQTLIDELEHRGFDVVGFDPLVRPEDIRDTFGIDTLGELTFAGFDALIVRTAHEAFAGLDIETVCAEMNPRPVVFDLAGRFDRVAAERANAVYRQL
jgi:UDP-N-acetyl-D-galactosamine dehydrogenase